MWRLKHLSSAKTACQSILLTAILMSLAVVAVIPNDITSQGACIEVTPSNDGEKLFDTVIHSEGLMTTTLMAIRIDWSACTDTKEEALVQGVFLFTDESQTTTAGALLKFFVGNDSGEEKECPDTNGVGVDAKGGVFNCGLSGTWIEVRCDSSAGVCPTTLAVAEFRVWKDKIVSIRGSPYAYNGNKYRYNGGSWNQYSYPAVSYTPPAAPEFEPIWGTGSYYSSSNVKHGGLRLSKGLQNEKGLGYQFETTVIISKVIFMRYAKGNDYQFQTGNRTFTSSDHSQNLIHEIGSNQRIQYAEIDIPISDQTTASDFLIDRGEYTHAIVVTKVIIFGELECISSIAPFQTKTWTKPAKWTTTEFEETTNLVAPELSICLDAAKQHSDLDYYFTSTNLVANGDLDWITFDKQNNKFILEPSRQEYEDYHGQTIIVKFEAFDASSATRQRHTATDFEFEIKFNSVVLEKCQASDLTAQSFMAPQTVQLFGGSQSITVPQVSDSGTTALQQILGHSSDTCGGFLYTPDGNLNSWVAQNSSDQRQFSFDLSQDYSLVGEHKLVVVVTSVDYPMFVDALTLEIDINVVCLSTNAPFQTKTWTKPAKWTTTEFEETTNLVAPELSICLDAAKQHSDLDYQFTSTNLVANGDLNWITFDKENNIFILEPSRQEYQDYHGQTIIVKFEAFDASLATRQKHTATDFEFEIKFNSVVLEKCQASVLTAQSSLAQSLSFFEDPQPFTVPQVSDTGTTALQSIPGHSSDTCGGFLYTPDGNLNSWVAQDSSDQRQFSFDLSQNYNLVGDHKLVVVVTSVDYPTFVDALTLEIDITVENPCLDKDYRKFLNMFKASEISFPVGSNLTDVEIIWLNQINFDEIAYMTEACGTYKLKVNPPSIFEVENLQTDEPQSGVNLRLKSLEHVPELTLVDFQSPQSLTVQAYYEIYEATTKSDIFSQDIKLIACDCTDGFVEELFNMTVPVSQKLDLLHTFEAPKCLLKSQICQFNWAYELRMRDQNQTLDTNMFVLDQKTGELKIKADLMTHGAEFVHELDLNIFNNVTRNMAQNFTIGIDILEEKLVRSEIVYEPDKEPNLAEDDLPIPTNETDFAFEIKNVEVQPIYCNQSDRNWNMTLPEVNNPQNLNFTMSFKSETENFVLDESNEQIALHKTFVAQLVKSQNCPSEEFFVLQFDISVEGYSEPIKKLIFVPVYQNTRDDIDLSQFKKMNITRLEFSKKGLLSVIFDKEIHPPSLIVSDPDPVQNRTLSTADGKYNITNVLSLTVEDVFLNNVDGDEKLIQDYYLTRVTNDTLEVQVVFQDPQTISSNINEPDRLQINITRLDVFLDAETGLALDKTYASQYVTMGEQYTETQLQKIEQIEGAVQSVSIVITLCQPIALLCAGKIVDQVLVLLYVLQLLAFISTWRINFTYATRIILTEIRRVSLGELFDDIDFGGSGLLREFFGISQESDKATTQEGNQINISVLQSIGLTQTLIFFVFAFLLLLSLLIFLLNRRFKCGCAKKLEDLLRKKLTPNTVVNYFFYNWIKIGIAVVPHALKFVTGEQQDLETIICFVSSTLLFFVMPIAFSFILIRNFDGLGLDETKAKFGALYANLSLLYFDGEKYIMRRRKSIVFWPLIFCMRRTMFVLTCVLWKQTPAIQLMVHYATTFCYFMYLARDDLFDSKWQQVAQVGSEVICVFAVILLSQLDNVPRDQAGETSMIISWMFITMVLILILFDFFIMFRLAITDCKQKKRAKSQAKFVGQKAQQIVLEKIMDQEVGDLRVAKDQQDLADVQAQEVAEDVLLVKNIEKVEAEETSYESSQSSGSARIEINLIPPFVGGQNCHRAPFHEESQQNILLREPVQEGPKLIDTSGKGKKITISQEPKLIDTSGNRSNILLHKPVIQKVKLIDTSGNNQRMPMRKNQLMNQEITLIDNNALGENYDDARASFSSEIGHINKMVDSGVDIHDYAFEYQQQEHTKDDQSLFGNKNGFQMITEEADPKVFLRPENQCTQAQLSLLQKAQVDQKLLSEFSTINMAKEQKLSENRNELIYQERHLIEMEQTTMNMYLDNKLRDSEAFRQYRYIDQLRDQIVVKKDEQSIIEQDARKKALAIVQKHLQKKGLLE